MEVSGSAAAQNTLGIARDVERGIAACGSGAFVSAQGEAVACNVSQDLNVLVAIRWATIIHGPGEEGPEQRVMGTIAIIARHMSG